MPFARIAFLSCIAVCSLASADNVQWNNNVEAALQSANQKKQLVLMKFTADWCGYCKKMERETFTQPAIAQVVNNQFTPVLVDADQHQELVRHLRIKGLPSILVVSPDMVILDRISGYQTADKLLPRLKAVAAKHGSANLPQTAGSATAPSKTRPVSQTNSNIFRQTAKAQQPAEFEQPSFGGLCLVSVRETRSLVSGTPQYSLRYNGKVLTFRDAQQLQKFKAAPQKYWPMRNGTCPVSETSGRPVEGRLEYAAMFRGKLWFTSSQQNLQTFLKSPSRFADALK